MSFFRNLFGNKQTAETVLKALQAQQASFQEKAQSKARNSPITEKELLQTFAEYFAPNTEFFSVPGSPKFTAYFKVVNTARDEMISNLDLFSAATKWTPQQLADLINNPKPGITNMLICGLIFSLGDYAVIKDALYCVDFCERIPNCIALYLLLIAQKQPNKSRKMIIDAGDGCNSNALSAALDTLKICDRSWQYKIG